MKTDLNTDTSEECDQPKSENQAGHILGEESDELRAALGMRINEAIGLAGGLNLAAHAAGVSASTLRRYVRAEVQAPFASMVGLARKAGISLEWLATGEGPRERPAADGTVPVGRGEGQERRPAPEPSGDKSLRNQGSRGTGQRQEGPPPIPTFDPGQPLAGFNLVKLQRLAACLAAAQRLPEELETGAQLMLAIRIHALIDYLVAQGADQGLIDQEDIDAMARLLFKLIKGQEVGLKEG